MKNLRILLFVIGLSVLVFAPDVFARFGQGAKTFPWGGKNQYSRKYDSNTVETIKGDVVSIDMVTYKQNKSFGVRMEVKTKKETVAVHLGPGWYLESQEIKVNKKDKVEVKGSRIIYDGEPVIVAAEVTVEGNKPLKLRDSRGVPAWTGKPGI